MRDRPKPHFRSSSPAFQVPQYSVAQFDVTQFKYRFPSTAVEVPPSKSRSSPLRSFPPAEGEEGEDVG
jgi:hypothetical protein